MKSGWVAVVVLALAIGAAWYFMRDPARQESFHSREIATRVLAEYLATKFPKPRVLVVSNPFTRSGAPSEVEQMENAGIDGLRKGFGKNASVNVVFPELKPEAQANPRSVFIDPETTTPLSFLVAENAFDKLLIQHPGHDLIVSLIGLPVALDKVRCWQTPGPPQFALLLPDLRMIGNAAAVQAAMKNGKLAAFVLARPAKENAKTEFDKEFLLVTPDNVEKTVQRYPTLFSREGLSRP